MHPAGERGDVSVLIAAEGDRKARRCTKSVRAHSPEGTTVLTVASDTSAVNRALEQLRPTDVIILSEPCLVTPGWLERLRDAARGDSNTATASALTDAGGELALWDAAGTQGAEPDLAQLAEQLAANTLTLRPRLRALAGPCVYVRREALELVGGTSPWRWTSRSDACCRGSLTWPPTTCWWGALRRARAPAPRHFRAP
jgi:hypothetical protein